jgi:hypothetical protein
VVRENESKRTTGVPRSRYTYRGWLRNNAVEWKGVEPDGTSQHPPLVQKISKRGEKHYVELWE